MFGNTFHRTKPGHCTSIALIAHYIRAPFITGTFRQQRVEEGKITVFLRAHFAVFVQAWLDTVSSQGWIPRHTLMLV